MADATVHCQRRWWQRPPVWFIGIAVVLALIVGIVVEEAGRHAPMPYGAFLDQLAAGNVASVTFQGTEIDGRLKNPLDNAKASDAAQGNAFHSQVPAFGDPALIAELRKRNVAIDVASSTSWTRLLSGLPWPMVLFIGVALIAGLVRFIRGGKTQPGSGMPTHPMQGMVGLISGLFAKPQEPQSRPTQDSSELKERS